MSKLTRKQFEEMLISSNVVEAFNVLTKPELTEMLDANVAAMVGYEQNNSHHCYNLFMHTLKAVESVSSAGLTPDQFKFLRVAAFFHDIAKPQVASFNPKTKQQVFYGHAEKSVEVAMPILKGLGYTEPEINQIGFLIAHHDDFISYRTEIEPYQFNHLYIRKISKFTIAEKMIENAYDFVAMGYLEEEIKGILFNLTQNKKPFFKVKSGNYQFNVDMTEVKEKMASGKFNRKFVPSLSDYEMLINLCKADSLAQSEVAKQDGKVVATKQEKMERNNLIESLLADAFNIFQSLNLS